MTVLDASAVVGVLLGTPGSAAVGLRLRDGDQDLHAPHLLDIEVVHVLRRFWLLGDIGEARALEAVDDLAALPVRRHPHHPFCTRIWELRHTLTAYGAAYVALAEGLEASLVTCDQRMAAEARNFVSVEAFG